MGTKHVQNGVLVATSPSSIEKWDETTSFGCQRAWWYESVQGLRSPPTESQLLGTDLHGMIEEHLGHTNRAPIKVRAPETKRLFLAVKPTVDQVIHEGIVNVETAMKLDVCGVVVNGRIDIETKTGILDWKTTSDFSKWAKTPGQLQKNTQMLLYAKWLDVTNPKKDYTLEHVYIQTKGKPRVERVKAKINKAMLDVGMDRIISLVEEMKVAAAETDVSKLKQADESKCRFCPHVAYCPKESKSLASLLNRFKAASPAVLPTAADNAPISVLPPDAPKSNPALAADPVPGFSTPSIEASDWEKGTVATAPSASQAAPTAPERKITIVDEPVKEPTTLVQDVVQALTPVIEEAVEKKGRGRPKGAKNKHRFAEAATPSVDANVRQVVASAPSNQLPPPVASMGTILNNSPLFSPIQNSIEFNTVTVSHGATINTGNFNSQRVDVTLSAKFTGSEAEAFEKCATQVRALLLKEVERVGLGLGNTQLNPGGKS